MLELYTHTGCPYCERVKEAFEDMGVPYEEVIAEWGTPEGDRLEVLGGKRQVPFLVDTENDVKMYESADIIAYVRGRFETN